MNPISLIQLGHGHVGKAFIDIVEEYKKTQPEVRIDWIDIRNSKGSICHPELDPRSHHHNTLVDLTASDSTTEQLLKARREGISLILANKNPLVEDQGIFNMLMSGPIGFSATVGAGLPAIPEIRRIIHEGQKITKIEGCLSGTMGVLFSELEAGIPFSDIIKNAVKKGFTEPDPRTDLSGGDVAKKLLILSRLSGYQLEIEDIKCEILYPDPMKEIELEDFMNHLSMFDNIMRSKVEKAESENKCIRYIASMDNGKCHVGMKSVLKTSPLGQLKNDQKRILIYSSQSTEPIIITGAGSGPKDTAKDLLNDLLMISKSLTL
jgi:homoserine dehydrogenase